jgi:hypothetical protein
MAIISIPTSIAGITVPGLNKGPLGALFNNQYSTKSIQYPSDLGSTNKNHMVRFEIREVISAEVDIGKWTGDGTFSVENGLKVLDTVGKATAKVWDGVQDQLKSARQKSADENVKGILNKIDSEKTLTENLNPGVSKILSTIQLYMPDSMDFQLGINYNDSTELLDAAASLPVIGGAARKLQSTIKNSAAQLTLKKLGYAVNPQLQLLFQDINFREYSMSFVFSPNSKEEAQNIQEIIKLFRGYAAPEIVRNTKGMFYRPPAYFDVSFYSNGVVNTKINRIKRSVVKSVDVNYAPNGWAAHSDGAPVQTTMTIQLQEIVLIDRNEIFNNGY